jgi:hypothetical protein
MKRLIIFLVMLAALAYSGLAFAQEPQVQLQVARVEPGIVTAYNPALVTVFGTGFTEATTVRLVGAGLVTVRFVNTGALLIEIPNTLGPSVYAVEVSDPQFGTALSPNPLSVVAPTATPLPPLEPTEYIPPPTLAPPTMIPGKPVLVARNFSVSPNPALPGQPVTLTMEIVNQGNRTAQGVSLALATGSKFIPAGGQSAATLPNIQPGTVVTASITVTAMLDAPAGPNTVPLTLAYTDFEGEPLTAAVTLSVDVTAQARTSTVVVSRYRTLPLSAQPGQELSLQLQLTNTGNDTAAEVIVKLKEGMLLPGYNGDSVVAGDLAPGASTVVELPVIVSQEAKSGIQPQALTILYTQGSEAKTVDTSVSLQVEIPQVNKPLLLLESYNLGDEEVLAPGQKFTMTFTLHNIGSASAENLLITFGTVETTGGDSGSGDGSSGGGSTGGSGSGSGGGSTTITPGNLFAPQGSGGALFAEALDAGKTMTLTQEFMVNGTAKSGIFNLPMTLIYQDDKNNSITNTVNASLPIVVLPRVQIVQSSPLPEMMNVGEAMPIGVTVTNLTSTAVRLINYKVEAENADILEGAEGILSNLTADEPLNLGAVVMAQGDGHVEITLTITYLDDLNQLRELVEVFEAEAQTPPPPEPMPEETPPPVVEETPAPAEDTLGRILLGLLGLGS